MCLSILPSPFGGLLPLLQPPHTQRLTITLETSFCARPSRDWPHNCSQFDGTEAIVRTHRVGASLEKSRDRCDRRGNRPGQLEKETRRTKSVLAHRSASFALVH